MSAIVITFDPAGNYSFSFVFTHGCLIVIEKLLSVLAVDGESERVTVITIA